MVCFTLWLIATTTFLGASRAFDGLDPSTFNPGGYVDPGTLRFEDIGVGGIIRKTCKDLNCDSGQVCVQRTKGPTCAVKNGLPCAFDDYCEGGYYCPGAKVCAGGPDGIPEGSSCPQGVGCKPGLYCDRSQKEYKCLKIQGGTFCTGDSQCKDSCPYAKGCYCYKGGCIPNP